MVLHVYKPVLQHMKTHTGLSLHAGLNPWLYSPVSSQFRNAEREEDGGRRGKEGVNVYRFTEEYRVIQQVVDLGWVGLELC